VGSLCGREDLNIPAEPLFLRDMAQTKEKEAWGKPGKCGFIDYRDGLLDEAARAGVPQTVLASMKEYGAELENRFRLRSYAGSREKDPGARRAFSSRFALELLRVEGLYPLPKLEKDVPALISAFKTRVEAEEQKRIAAGTKPLLSEESLRIRVPKAPAVFAAYYANGMPCAIVTARGHTLALMRFSPDGKHAIAAEYPGRKRAVGDPVASMHPKGSDEFRKLFAEFGEACREEAAKPSVDVFLVAQRGLGRDVAV